MRPVILYRKFDMTDGELDAGRKYFDCFSSRMLVSRGDLVIGRYSVLPFYTEQARDMEMIGARLINSHQEHLYVADIRNWYEDLKSGTELGSQITPRTWYSAHEMMLSSYEGPFVVKGITNSKKHLWKTHMFAETKQDAMKVMLRLQEDALLSTQQIVFRQYVPLKRLTMGLNDMPITKEFRFFVCGREVLCGAYYWSSHVYDLEGGVGVPDASEVPSAFLGEVVNRIGDNCTFYVVDIAQTEQGAGWSWS
jgi:hypothetical protein